MKFRQVIGFVAIFGAGYLSAMLLSPQDLVGNAFRITAGSGVQPSSASIEDRLVQTDFGTRCSTPQGVCGLPQPQPIGSVCFCDSTRGTTIR
jgi:hypothetical protein